MFRTSDVILIAVMLSAAAFTYKTKHDAQATMNRIATLKTEIQLEKDAIDVLKADWSLLAQPGRLETLTKAYESELGLATLEPKQIVGVDALREIPFRKDKTLMVEGVPADGSQDPVVTGGVRQ